jgi:hypothetical protein
MTIDVRPPLVPPPGWPYFRAAWTEHRLRFWLPRDEPVISTCLRDYASQEEIDAVIAAVRQARRNLTARIRAAQVPPPRRMSKAARDDVALDALWAVEDRRRLGWLLADLRRGELPSNLEDRLSALPKVPARELLLQFQARYRAAEEAALDLVQACENISFSL